MALLSMIRDCELPFLHILYALAPILLALIAFSRPSLWPEIPTVGVDDQGWFRFSKARARWAEQSRQIIEEGRRQFSTCFQVFTSIGPKIVIPNKFADELRNNPHMNMSKALETEFFGSYSGFIPFKHSQTSDVLLEVVKGRLTQSLNFITEELSDEASKTTKTVFGEPETWTEITYKPMLLELIARISARVFVGEELCENEEWLAITKEYTVDLFIAIETLRTWSPWLRPIVHWFLPECRKIRAQANLARRIIRPVVEQQRARNAMKQEAGEAMSKKANTIGWMDMTAEGRDCDVAAAQLSLSFAAIHTTTEMLSGLIGDLCANPDLFKPLRDEVRTVLSAKGWCKAALHDLKLMDSAMKESQRHHFGDIAAMTRRADESVKLSDGSIIPKGALTMVSIERMNDESIFAEPHKFNGRRFFEMRQQPGHENKWHFVTTSSEHLAFGHGQHACPGRFFAGNEVKVALCHLLMKYDWKFTKEGRKEDRLVGQLMDADPTAKVLIRRRKEKFAL